MSLGRRSYFRLLLLVVVALCSFIVLQKSMSHKALRDLATEKSQLNLELLRPNIHTIEVFQQQKITSAPTTKKSSACSVCRTGKCSAHVEGTPYNNPLIDCYGQSDVQDAGDRGRGVVFMDHEQSMITMMTDKFGINVNASDLIALNRRIPDSRPEGCSKLSYRVSELPTLAVVLPFHDEWPSLLLRSVYSIINRTPRRLLKQIILVDDASQLPQLGGWLEQYIQKNFPPNLVTLVRLKKRSGLIRGRLEGFKHVTADVVSFQDSHIEMVEGWAEPLLNEIKKDRRTVAMSQLDYINKDNFSYRYYVGYRTRYLIDWSMLFFEDYWRPSQVVNKKATDPLPGVIMCGSGFAIESAYFREIGTYDEGMDIWGAENIEMGLRVSLCGGRLIHVPCSHVGHVPRVQPYTFPGGRDKVTAHNYKRMAEVWFGPYKDFIYEARPAMKEIRSEPMKGIEKRFEIKKRLQCKSIDWYFENINPELFPYTKNVSAWRQLRNEGTGQCLDTKGHLFQYDALPAPEGCTGQVTTQWVSLTTEGHIRTGLHCLYKPRTVNERRVVLGSCLDQQLDVWKHKEGGAIVHAATSLCLSINAEKTQIILEKCDELNTKQRWRFEVYVKQFLKHRPPKPKEPTKTRLMQTAVTGDSVEQLAIKQKIEGDMQRQQLRPVLDQKIPSLPHQKNPVLPTKEKPL